MANQKIFCNTPWYEAHIYWNGDLGICCQESQKLYPQTEEYNIKNMSLAEWFNSQPVKQFRQQVLSDTKTEICKYCYHEESMGGTSRRHRENHKSVIFTNIAFDDSYDQSPGYSHFKLSQDAGGITDTMPIDLHIDLGNYCNLACKMCWSGASTKIATQYVKWGHVEDKQYLGNDWTKDSTVWNRFLNELLSIPKLKNIHLMGGETLLTPKFEELVDFMILHKKFDVCFSFVTNGTIFNESLMKKLSQFSRVGVEVSIETITEHNDYVRQNTNTSMVLLNIKKYQEYSNDKISVTLRPAISALTIGYFDTLLDYCLDNALLIKSLIVTTPAHLNVNILPTEVKLQYINKFRSILDKVSDITISGIQNESDPTQVPGVIKIQALQAINLLNQAESKNQEKLLESMVSMCRKWDDVYKFDAIKLYPELKEVFDRYGY